MFSNNLEAKVYNYSCDYSFVAPGTGETIKFRIRVYDLDEAYIKGKEASYWENDSFWKEHVAFMPFKDGKYKPFEYTWANSGETKDFDGRNSKGCAPRSKIVASIFCKSKPGKIGARLSNNGRVPAL